MTDRIDLVDGYYLFQVRPTDMTCSLHASDGLHIGNLRSEHASGFADAIERLTRERDELFGYLYGNGGPTPTVVEKIAELHARAEKAEKERDEAIEARAHDLARQSSIIAFLRKRRGELVIERDEARAAALEEAARVAERRVPVNALVNYDVKRLVLGIAAAIRTLAAKEGGHE